MGINQITVATTPRRRDREEHNEAKSGYTRKAEIGTISENTIGICAEDDYFVTSL
jgi:hypothetical protein